VDVGYRSKRNSNWKLSVIAMETEKSTAINSPSYILI